MEDENTIQIEANGHESESREFMLGYIFGTLCSKGIISYEEKKSKYMISFSTMDKGLFEVFTFFWEIVIKGSYNTYKSIHNGKERLIFRSYDKKTARRLFYNYGLRTGAARWKAPAIINENTESAKGFLSGSFEAGSYIRSRIRVKKGKREKIRNIRIVSSNRFGLEYVKNLLMEFGIKPMVYSSGKNFCLDIEGKMKLEIFGKRIGFLTNEKKYALLDALSFIS